MDVEVSPGYPYVLKRGEGWVYRYGVDLTVKAGELYGPTNATVMTYKAKRGERADTHTHATEDEMFYVCKGAVTFWCGDEKFKLKRGGFIYLPHGMAHSYKVKGKKAARVMVITCPARQAGKEGWGGFVAAMEGGQAELIKKPPFEEDR